MANVFFSVVACAILIPGVALAQQASGASSRARPRLIPT